MFAVSEQEYLLSKCYFTEQRITNKHETKFLLILLKIIMYRYFKEYRYPGSLYMKIMTSVICATNHALSWYFLRIEDTFLKKKNVVKQWVFFYHHHPPPHKPIQPFKEHKRCILTTTRYSSPTSWSRLHIKDVVVANLVPILYFTLCIYIKKKGQRGRKNHGLMYSRRGNKEKVIAIAFKISTHLASIVAYSIFYILSSARAGRVLGKFLTIVRFKYL